VPLVDDRGVIAARRPGGIQGLDRLVVRLLDERLDLAFATRVAARMATRRLGCRREPVRVVAARRARGRTIRTGAAAAARPAVLSFRVTNYFRNQAPPLGAAL